MKSGKSVSIITPTYNSEAFIAQNIASVLNQTYSDWEHIIVDDCSYDKTVQVIENFKRDEPRIRLIQLKQNSGAGVARNTAIKAAQGQYIAFLDADDAWHPEKLKQQISFMQEYQFPFTFTAYQHQTPKGVLLSTVSIPPKTLTYRKALLKNPIGCLTVIYDTHYFGKQFMPKVRKRQDFALWLNLLKKSDGHGLQQVLAYYTIGNQSISSNKLDLIKYEWHIYRNVENLGLFTSLFYLGTAIFAKLFKVNYHKIGD